MVVIFSINVSMTDYIFGKNEIRVCNRWSKELILKCNNYLDNFLFYLQRLSDVLVIRKSAQLMAEEGFLLMASLLIKLATIKSKSNTFTFPSNYQVVLPNWLRSRLLHQELILSDRKINITPKKSLSSLHLIIVRRWKLVEL